MFNPQLRTTAYPHNSRFLQVHSYTPSPAPSSDDSIDLQVLCTLYTAALADSTPDGTPAPPKTIRLCFSALPLATRVARAPAELLAPSLTPGAQDLVLSCKIPTKQQVDAAGIVHSSEAEGRVSLYCEILGGGGSVLGEAVAERVWFGDYDYEGGGGSLAWIQPPTFEYSRKRASPNNDEEDEAVSSHCRPRLSTKGSDDHSRASSYGCLDVQYGGSYQNGESYSYPHSPELGGPSYDFQGSPHPHYFQPPPFHAHTPTSLSPPSPHDPYAPYNPATAAPSALGGFQQQIPPPPPQHHQLGLSGGSPSNSPPAPPHPSQPEASTSSSAQARGRYGERAAEGAAKASLELHGDLFTMAVGWNEDEWHARRRLVQFWRKMEGSKIHASFAPISQAEFKPSAIVISCIFREEMNECYVTSVDAIYLLEGLIGVRFSIEEKNRVRRNLQRCKPDTISKNKKETEEFFTTLMNFPTPKPRHIEKDIKVFKWKEFAGALERTVAKYSISFVDHNGLPSPSNQPSEEGGGSGSAGSEEE